MMPNSHTCKLHSWFIWREKYKYSTLNKYIKKYLRSQTALFCNMVWSSAISSYKCCPFLYTDILFWPVVSAISIHLKTMTSCSPLCKYYGCGGVFPPGELKGSYSFIFHTINCDVAQSCFHMQLLVPARYKPPLAFP